MKKFKKVVCSLILIALCVGFLSGCNFFSSAKVSTPSVSVDSKTNTLYFDADYNATSYEIYINERLVGTIEETATKTQQSFNYGSLIKKAGEYRIQVKAIGGGSYKDSDMSNTKSVIVGNAIDVLNNNLSAIDYNLTNTKASPNNVKIEKSTAVKVTWQAPNNPVGTIDEYVVSLYSNALGVKNVVVGSTSDSTLPTEFVLTNDYIVSNDVIAVRVSAVYDDEYYASDIKYYNPMDTDERGVYTDTIYTFKGGVYDYFIENLDELKNIYYYAFISRITDLKFMVLKSFYNNYSSTYFETVSNIADDYIVGYSYYETYGFTSMPSLSKMSSKTEDKVFRLTCQFDVKQCDYTGEGASETDLNESIKGTPYYETVDYTKRDASTHIFASDTRLLSTTVSSSEELLWAVTHNVTPLPVAGSRADLIYTKAKQILNEIISDEMTDYEKALSIFDYIMNNSTYDYCSLGVGSSNPSFNPMTSACYYLEGLFLSETKLVVCDAMSKTFALLCNMEDIVAVRVMGDVSGGGHAWNKVYINNKWYVVDITWTKILAGKSGLVLTNPQYATQYHKTDYSYGGDNSDISEVCAHIYFMVDDDFISTHTAFDKEVLYKMMGSNESFDYYNQVIYTEGKGLFAKKLTRIIDDDEDLQLAFNYMLKNNVNYSEFIFSKEYITNSKTDGKSIYTSADIMNAIKKNKVFYSGVKLEFVNETTTASVYATKTNLEYVEEGIEFTLADDSKCTVYYYLPEQLSWFEYSSSKIGVIVMLKINPSLSSARKLNEYLSFAVSNNIKVATNVSITKEFIKEVIVGSGISESEYNSYTDVQRIAKLQELLNTQLAGYNKSLTITRMSQRVWDDTTNSYINTMEDVAETMLVQNETTLEYEQKTASYGAYKFVFQNK